jgi:hypothetical protein
MFVQHGPGGRGPGAGARKGAGVTDGERLEITRLMLQSFQTLPNFGRGVWLRCCSGAGRRT